MHVSMPQPLIGSVIGICLRYNRMETCSQTHLLLIKHQVTGIHLLSLNGIYVPQGRLMTISNIAGWNMQCDKHEIHVQSACFQSGFNQPIEVTGLSTPCYEWDIRSINKFKGKIHG